MLVFSSSGRLRLITQTLAFLVFTAAVALIIWESVSIQRPTYVMDTLDQLSLTLGSYRHSQTAQDRHRITVTSAGFSSRFPWHLPRFNFCSLRARSNLARSDGLVSFSSVPLTYTGWSLPSPDWHRRCRTDLRPSQTVPVSMLCYSSRD